MDSEADTLSHGRNRGFPETIGPIFQRDGHYCLAVEARHANTHSTAHGGLLTAFADQAIGWTVLDMLEPGESCLTLQLSTRFVGGAAVGDMIWIQVSVPKRTRSYMFVTATVLTGDEPVALCEGIWRVIRT